jgi:hypothetical protein
VYPADFTFGGFPLTWVRTFTASGNKGAWKTLQQSNIAFKHGDGFVLWVDPVNNPSQGLNSLNNIHELPYFENHNSDAFPAHTYNPVNKKSTFKSFPTPNQSYDVDRNTTSAYQLAEGSFNKSYEVADGFALVGNPFMAALDFDLFSAAANSSAINPTYYVWINSVNGDGTGAYGHYSSGIGDIGNLIAPLQGFIVDSKTQGSVSLHFNESMASANSNAKLRSSANNNNTLSILARNPVMEVRTFIAKREGGQDEYGNMDARKLMNDISSVPEIYTLKPYQGKTVAAAINIIENDNQLIPVGLATSYSGNITLSFTGMDNYNANLTLIDIVANKEIDLTGLDSYNYVFDYTPKMVNGKPAACEDRFFIRISKSVTGLEESIAGKVIVYESNGLIQVISTASNPIKEVAVYDLQGMLVYKANARNEISHTVNMNRPAGVYVVTVVSEKNSDNVKIVTR